MAPSPPLQVSIPIETEVVAHGLDHLHCLVTPGELSSDQAR